MNAEPLARRIQQDTQIYRDIIVRNKIRID